MDNHTETTHNLIEYLLSIPGLSQSGPTATQDSRAATLPQKAAPLTEAQHRETALQIASFMDEMPGGFFIYRADGDEEILYANQALLRIFGCGTMQEFREMTGNSFRGIVHPDD